MDRENYDELIKNIDSVGADDIAHFSMYGAYNKDSLQHTREVSELIRAYGESCIKEKYNVIPDVVVSLPNCKKCNDLKAVPSHGTFIPCDCNG